MTNGLRAGRPAILPATLLATLLAVGLLAGCGSDSSAADGGTIAVVASTNVYGDIAGRVGGDDVSVRSIISDPSQDPHSYEADARTKLALTRADVVVENGGGYDDFVDTLLSDAGGDATVINAVKVSGIEAPAGGELNEHVWYDFDAMRKLTDRMADAFAAERPSAAATFRSNARAFDAQLAKLTSAAKAVATADRGAGAAITEPVPLYLLHTCGLVNRTPAAFSEAVEEGDDVPVGVLDDTLGLFRNHTVKVLVYNQQTEGAVTDKVLSAAQAARVPVVPVTETLPAGKNYLTWMQANVAAIKAALA